MMLCVPCTVGTHACMGPVSITPCECIECAAPTEGDAT